MPLDLKRMNQRREEIKRSSGGREGSFLKFEEGETLVYMHGLIYPEDDHDLTRGYNFIEVVQHFGVGGKRAGQVCLDPIANPIILHPIVQQFLAKRKKPIKIDKDCKCPVCVGRDSGEIEGEDAERQRPQNKWVFGLTPVYYRSSKEDEWSKKKFEPSIHIAGVKLMTGFTGEMIDMGKRNISDVEAVVLLKVSRTGKDFDNTDYEVATDKDSLVQPIKLDKPQRRVIADAVKPGGACDLFKVVANMIKSPVELKALIVGTRVEEEAAAGDDDERKPCFGIDWVEGDAECKACAEYKECGEARGGAGGEAAVDSEPEPEAEASEPEAEAGEAEADGDDSGDCFGSWEDCDDCNNCAEEAACREDTEGGEPGADTDAEEADRAGAAEPEEEPEQQSEDDPALRQIEEEAKRLTGSRKKKGGKK